MKPGDAIIVDHDFCDCLNDLHSFDYDMKMPLILKENQTQHK